MSAKIHVSPEFGPRPCRARVKSCPYQHFETLKEATKFYEDYLEENYGTFTSHSRLNFTNSFDSLLEETDAAHPIEWKADGSELEGVSKAVKEVTLVRLNKAMESERAITQDLHDGLQEGVELSSLEFRLKSPSSTARKIMKEVYDSGLEEDEAEYKHYENAANSLNDIVRYTYDVEEHDDLTGFIKTQTDDFIKKGYVPKKAKNAYQEGNPYKGFAVIWTDTDGENFEVQYHSKESSRIKEKSHAHYEIFRDAIRYDAQTRAAAELACRNLSKDLKPPAGLDDIEKIGDIPVAKVQY